MDSLQDSQSAPTPQLEQSSELDKISSDLLTIILTTSPVPSSPSPELIQNTLASLPPALKDLHIIITFDSFKVAPDDKARLKQGKIPEELAESYPQYIENVKGLFPKLSEDAEIEEEEYFKSHAQGVTFLRMKTRQGFAFSVKEALTHVETPYVLILQHDWLFTVPHPPITTLFSILQNEPEDVKYIVFMARGSLEYVKSKEIVPNFRYTFSEALKLRKDRVLGAELQACFHWFDRPHLCSVEVYKKIFSMHILKRGDFIEDTFGTKYLTAIHDASTKQDAFLKWKKYGAWIYYPNDGKVLHLRHGNGRSNLLGVKQEELIEGYKKSSKKRDKKAELVLKYGQEYVNKAYSLEQSANQQSPDDKNCELEQNEDQKD